MIIILYKFHFVELGQLQWFYCVPGGAWGAWGAWANLI